MQILHFCPLPLFSGLEQYALAIATRQQQKGHDVSMVVLKGSALEAETAKAGLKSHVVSFDHGVKLLTAARQYGEILEQASDTDVVHLHTSHDIERLRATYLLSPRLRRNRRPKIIQQNHIWISHSKRDPIHWFKYRLLDEVWCSSEPAKRDLVRYLPVPESKIQVIKYGRDLSVRQTMMERTEARRALSLPENALILGAIARIDRGKGIGELVGGAIEVMRSHSDLQLAIIGGPTMSDPKSIEFAKEIEGMLRKLPTEIGGRIHLKGSLPDAAKYLRAFDLYAQVSYKETFSLALLDAQLAGLPVLGTRSGGTPEVVIEGRTGWLCEPEDTTSLVRALERAVGDRANWNSFGRSAQLRVEKEFDIESVMNDILNRYGSGKEPANGLRRN